MVEMVAWRDGDGNGCGCGCGDGNNGNGDDGDGGGDDGAWYGYRRIERIQGLPGMDFAATAFVLNGSLCGEITTATNRIEVAAVSTAPLMNHNTIQRISRQIRRNIIARKCHRLKVIIQNKQR